jgi:chemotaxis protein MotB
MSARLKQVIEDEAEIYHVVKQLIVGTLHGHPMPLIIEAARVSISHEKQPTFSEVFDGMRGKVMADASQAPATDAGSTDQAPPVGSTGVVPAGGEGSANNVGVVAPIIVKKIVGGHGGAHGGAWKIALADMMTAMMAFFLLMWLLGASDEDRRKSIADYFRASVSHSTVELGRSAGAGGLLGGQSIIDPDGFPFAAKQTSMLERVTPQSEGGPTETRRPASKGSGPTDEEARRQDARERDEQAFDNLEREIKDKLAQNKRLEGVKDQVQFVREKEGLRIEIIDKADFAMFAVGTSRLLPRSEALVAEVAASVAKMGNKMAVRGHTDSLPFAQGDDRTNWSLSAERAEATRVALESAASATSASPASRALPTRHPSIQRTPRTRATDA